MKTKIIIMVSILLVVVGVLGFFAFVQNSKEDKVKQKAPETLEESYKVVSKMGKDSAPVQIVEFGDYKCPFCKRFNEDFAPFVEKEYVETGKVQFHFINFAFIGTDSIYMAEFAETVRQELGEESFWKFHDLIYQNQANERDIWGTEENMTFLLKQIASEKEVKQVLQSVKKGEYKQNIQDQAELVKKLKVKGTPAIFINGKLAEYKGYEELHKLIEDAVNEQK